MTQHNVGALVVVKPGEQKSIAGIITERGISFLSVPKFFEFYRICRMLCVARLR